MSRGGAHQVELLRDTQACCRRRRLTVDDECVHRRSRIEGHTRDGVQSAKGHRERAVAGQAQVVIPIAPVLHQGDVRGGLSAGDKCGWHTSWLADGFDRPGAGPSTDGRRRPMLGAGSSPRARLVRRGRRQDSSRTCPGRAGVDVWLYGRGCKQGGGRNGCVRTRSLSGEGRSPQRSGASEIRRLPEYGTSPPNRNQS